MSNPPSTAAWRNSGSFSLMWHLALSCWMKIGSCIASLGHFSFMAGITFSIKFFY
jgi:hypothetical protein